MNQNITKLWKNQRIIDSDGLVVCEDRERLFDNFECVTHFEDLLKVYQSKDLISHYLYYDLDPENNSQFECITYRSNVGYLC